MKTVATSIHQGSQTSQEVVFDLFFYVRTFQNLAGIEEHVDRCGELIGGNLGQFTHINSQN